MESRSRRTKRTAFFLMLFTAGALGISSAQALTLNPPTYSIAFSGIPGAVSSSGAVPQSGTYFYNAGTLDVSAAAATTAQPGVSAGVGSGGCTSGYPGSGCAGGGIGDSASVVYQVESSGPPGVKVPYFVNTAGGITALNQTTGGSAQVTLSAPGGSGLTGFTARVWSHNLIQ